MDKRFCAKCGRELSEDAKFCPQCGSNIQNQIPKVEFSQNDNIKKKKFSWKPVIIISSIFVAVIIVAIVVIAILNSSNLQNLANNSKNTVSVKVGETEISDKLGNLPGNITAGSQSLYKNDTLFYIADDGIYKTKNLNEEINKENSEQIANGSFSCLNIHDNDLACIDKKAKSIIKLHNVFDDGKPTVEKFYTSAETLPIEKMVVVNDRIYGIFIWNQSCSICSIDYYKSSSVSEVFKGSGSTTWLCTSENYVSFCFAGQSSWTAWRFDASSNKTPKVDKIASGTGIPVDIAFSDTKVYCVEKSSNNNSGKIIVLDSSGSRQEINSDCKITKLLLCGETIFAYSSGKNFIWFNTDTSMTHDIDNDKFKDSDVASINLNNKYFCVIYKDASVVTTDINELH